jgi:hypothetical protein
MINRPFEVLTSLVLQLSYARPSGNPSFDRHGYSSFDPIRHLPPDFPLEGQGGSSTAQLSPFCRRDIRVRYLE